MSKAKDKGVATLDRSASHLLHRALQVALDLYAEEVGPDGVTQRQYAVLAAVAENEGATQSDLVRITGIDRSTLADMAQRMIAKNLLERERSAVDARANAVSLTELGRAVLEAAGPKVASADGKFLKRLSGGGRREAFLTLLRELTIAGDDGAPAAGKRKKIKADRGDKPAKASGKKKRKKAA